MSSYQNCFGWLCERFEEEKKIVSLFWVPNRINCAWFFVRCCLFLKRVIYYQCRWTEHHTTIFNYHALPNIWIHRLDLKINLLTQPIGFFLFLFCVAFYFIALLLGLLFSRCFVSRQKVVLVQEHVFDSHAIRCQLAINAGTHNNFRVIRRVNRSTYQIQKRNPPVHTASETRTK